MISIKQEIKGDATPAFEGLHFRNARCHTPPIMLPVLSTDLPQVCGVHRHLWGGGHHYHRGSR